MSAGQSAHRAEADLVKVKDGHWSETPNDKVWSRGSKSQLSPVAIRGRQR